MGRGQVAERGVPGICTGGQRGGGCPWTSCVFVYVRVCVASLEGSPSVSQGRVGKRRPRHTCRCAGQHCVASLTLRPQPRTVVSASSGVALLTCPSGLDSPRNRES